MSTNRRNVIALMGFVAAGAPAARAATMSDWLDSIRVASQLSRAGIDAKAYTMMSSSMEPSLNVQDVVLADLRQGGLEPARGEMIAARFKGSIVIKRAIGLPGDHIGIRGGQVVLNGVTLPWDPAGGADAQPIAPQTGKARVFAETPPGGAAYRVQKLDAGNSFLDEREDILVPAGQLYVLGDNRDNSLDSRTPSFGLLPIADVVGRIIYRSRPNAGWLVPRSSVPGLPPD